MRPSPSKTIVATLGTLQVGIAVFGRMGKGAQRSRPGSHSEESTKPPPYRPPRGAVIGLGVLLVAGAIAHAGYGYKVQHDRKEEAIRLTGGDPGRGQTYLIVYGCAGCHTIPGIARANGLVGPSLVSMGRRVYIGGVLPNTPDNLTHWIVNPREINPKTAMPITGISDQEARDVVAYFYSVQ